MKIDRMSVDGLLSRCEVVPWSGCWIWLGTTNDGYGRVGSKKNKERAHRRMWLVAHGPIPPGLHVLHRCDVRCCINPSHLFLGTNAANMADKVKKNRQRGAACGERNTSAKLSSGKVSEIRKRYMDGASGRDLAREYGVARRTVRDVLSGITWRHVRVER